MDRGAWWATVGTALHGVITVNGHKAAALVHAACFFFFFFPVNSLLFSIGVEWISAVFVLGVQELDSVIHRCLLPLGLSYTQMFAPFRA